MLAFDSKYSNFCVKFGLSPVTYKLPAAIMVKYMCVCMLTCVRAVRHLVAAAG